MSKRIPFRAIKPAAEIVDLINGNADIVIVNPWIRINGLTPADPSTFLNIKPASPNSKFGGTTIISPHIAAKCDGTFIESPLFTDDTGANTLCNRIRSYGLYDTPEHDDYYIKLKDKSIQKFTITYGKFDTSNQEMVSTSIVNYQLTQAMELCILMRMLGFRLNKETNDQGALQSILNDFKSHAIRIPENQQAKYNKYLDVAGEKLTEYLKFNTTGKRYTVHESQADDDPDPEPTDLFKIFQHLIRMRNAAISANPSDKSEQLFKSYANILNSIAYRPINPACQPHHYAKQDKDGRSTEGTSLRTSYTFGLGSSYQPTYVRCSAGEKSRPMTIDDCIALTQPQMAKIFFTLDLDFRVYSRATSSVISLRYKVCNLLYKPAQEVVKSIADTSDIDMGEDTMTTPINTSINTHASKQDTQNEFELDPDAF